MKPGLRTHRSASLRIAVCEGLPVEMWERTREIIGVQSTNPRKGHATALMWETCADADRSRLTLIVQPHKFADGMDDAQLVKWYAKFGFTELQKEPVLLLSRMPQSATVMRSA